MKRLPNSRITDDDLRAMGWRRVWLVYSRTGEPGRCRGRVIRFDAEQIFATSDRELAEALLQRDECAYEGVEYYDQHGDRVSPPSTH